MPTPTRPCAGPRVCAARSASVPPRSASTFPAATPPRTPSLQAPHRRHLLGLRHRCRRDVLPRQASVLSAGLRWTVVGSRVPRSHPLSMRYAACRRKCRCRWVRRSPPRSQPSVWWRLRRTGHWPRMWLPVRPRVLPSAPRRDPGRRHSRTRLSARAPRPAAASAALTAEQCDALSSRAVRKSGAAASPRAEGPPCGCGTASMCRRPAGSCT